MNNTMYLRMHVRNYGLVDVPFTNVSNEQFDTSIAIGRPGFTHKLNFYGAEFELLGVSRVTPWCGEFLHGLEAYYYCWERENKALQHLCKELVRQHQYTRDNFYRLQFKIGDYTHTTEQALTALFDDRVCITPDYGAKGYIEEFGLYVSKQDVLKGGLGGEFKAVPINSR